MRTDGEAGAPPPSLVDSTGDVVPYAPLSSSGFLRMDDYILQPAQMDELTLPLGTPGALSSSSGSSSLGGVTQGAAVSTGKRERPEAAVDVSINKAAGRPRKKRVSRGSACERCRKGRRKCDRGQPCGECQSKGAQCVRPTQAEEPPPNPFDGTGMPCDAKFEFVGGAPCSATFIQKAKCVWASKRLCAALGFTLDELRGQAPCDFMHERDAKMVEIHTQQHENLQPSLFLGMTELRAYSIARFRHRDGTSVCFHIQRCAEFSVGLDMATTRMTAASASIIKSISPEEADDFLKRHNLSPPDG